MFGAGECIGKGKGSRRGTAWNGYCGPPSGGRVKAGEIAVGCVPLTTDCRIRIPWRVNFSARTVVQSIATKGSKFGWKWIWFK